MTRSFLTLNKLTVVVQPVLIPHPESSTESSSPCPTHTGPHRSPICAGTCKHWSAYDIEGWRGNDRHHFNAIVQIPDLVDYYWQPFKACVQEAEAASIMCSCEDTCACNHPVGSRPLSPSPDLFGGGLDHVLL